MNAEDIKIPTTREECIELAIMISEELAKIQKILDDAFERCEKQLADEQIRKNLGLPVQNGVYKP